MKQIDLSYKNTPDTGWHLLGEIKLSVSSETNSAISIWLTELLNPLDLSSDFMNRVMESAQDSVMRRLHSNNAASWFGHIHLTVYAPYERIPERKTWGFFHIERIENREDTFDARDHAIDYYLYVEGQ